MKTHTTDQHPQTTSPDAAALSMVPVVLGAPSPRRRSGRTRRPVVVDGPTRWSSARDRLSAPR